MTAEEFFEKWWTPKELPENGFNKTAMLDFAEMYHNINDVSGNAYLVAIKSMKEIKQRIIVANDVFDVEKKVLQTFKFIEWWEIRCNYGTTVF